MAVKNRAFRSKLRRKSAGPRSFTDRINAITTPLDRPPSAPEFGSGVIPPGTSRYQRMSAHLPSGVTRFQGIQDIAVDAAVELGEGEPSVDLTSD